VLSDQARPAHAKRGKTDRSRQVAWAGPFEAVRHFGWFENCIASTWRVPVGGRGPLLVRQVFLAGKLWSRRRQNERQGYFWTYR
jgi:protein-S-isoprenylcysteine O-methyltransferase Ste14